MPRLKRKKSPEGAGERAPAAEPRSRSRRGGAVGGDQLASHLFVRALGLVYLLAFLSLGWQIGGLAGRDGVFPFARFLAAAKAQLGAGAWREVPTLLWLSSSDDALDAVWLLGATAAVLAMVGRLVAPSLAAAWVCYLSLVVVGGDFLEFQWDSLLLETGLLAIFLLPPRLHSRFAEGAPYKAPLWLLRFLLFRLMWGSGLVKLLSGDPAWRSLKALEVHYETQPLPTVLGWWAHQLPPFLHQASALSMFLIELLAPLLIFAPAKYRRWAFWPLIGLQLLIVATGNYGFFNLLSLALCLLLLDDAAFPRRWARRVKTLPASGLQKVLGWSFWPLGAVLGLLALVVFASAGLRIRADWPQPLVSLYRLAAPLRSVNSYGLFAVMTMERHELFIEGSRDGREWQAYTFKWKPENPQEAPSFVAPHMPRLDWQMWFAALGSPDGSFFRTLLSRLAAGDRAVLELFAHNPFPDGPPNFLRVRKERWRFTDRETRKATGAWWSREDEGYFLPPTATDRLQ
jgi:lipase maturation factor 1